MGTKRKLLLLRANKQHGTEKKKKNLYPKIKKETGEIRRGPSSISVSLVDTSVSRGEL
jgi:hypothetical protein